MNSAEEQNPTELLLSQLVDGELPADQAARLLADVLDDAAARESLGAMLRLRLALDPWRRQGPAPAIEVAAVEVPAVETPAIETPAVAVRPAAGPARTETRHWRGLAGLAAAAALGGLLVAGGFYLGARLGEGQGAGPVAGQPQEPAAAPRSMTPEDARPQFAVTPAQRREIARVFALHESVAGPLSWYAADDSSIELGAADKQEASRRPIAVVLRLVPAASCGQGGPKTYVIVCRSDDTAAIELPKPAEGRALRVRLHSTLAGGDVNLQYAIAADGPGAGPDQDAVLAGRRRIGLAQTPLGQLALGNCLVSVDASAWAMGEERAP